MNANELYALKPTREYFDFSSAISAASHINMNSGEKYPLQYIFDEDRMEYEDINKVDEEKRVKLSYYMEEGDDKYGAILYSISMDDKPFMIVQKSGRWYGETITYLTDEKILKEFEGYILEKFPLLPENEKLDVLDPTLNLPELTKFADYDMEDVYDPNLKPLYKEGDEVWGWVQENHLKYSVSTGYKGYVLTKVLIETVNSTHPTDTYFGIQTERMWENSEMILSNKGGIGTRLNDHLIVGRVNEIDMPKLAINNLVDKDGKLPDSYIVKNPFKI